tara:strand:- start:11084 stop:11602 length:519 start_codon:yes stop_codon:yes gene_type:complete
MASSCAVVPGQANLAKSEARQSASHYFNEGREISLEGSHLLFVPKMNPLWWLGNADRDYDETWKPEKSHEWRKFTFALRNPGHNFTHYVIGVSDRDIHRVGIAAEHVWNPDGGLNLAVTNSGPLIHLPFVSNKGPFFEGYLGWRQDGNFGAAFRKSDRRKESKSETGEEPIR